MGVVTEEEAVRAVHLERGRGQARPGKEGFRERLGFGSNLDEGEEVIVRDVCWGDTWSR